MTIFKTHEYGKLMLTLIVNKWNVKVITVARILNGLDALRKTGRTLIWGSHRPQHRLANVKLLVAIDETGFKVLTFWIY
jgi:hypothetical protein